MQQSDLVLLSRIKETRVQECLCVCVCMCMSVAGRNGRNSLHSAVRRREDLGGGKQVAGRLDCQGSEEETQQVLHNIHIP